MDNQLPEPLLQKSDKRYVIFPIEHHDIYKFYKDHEDSKWPVKKIDMASDLPDWKKLDEPVKKLIKHILAFFAASDGIIMENLSENFCSEVQWAEVRAFYAVQNYMENIHSITYSKLIETYVESTEEKLALFNAIESMPAIRAKARWAEKWISSKASFAKRLVAFAIVEGLFFSVAFAIIYFVGELRKMPGLCMSNDYISRDEGMHVDFAVLLYTKHIVNKITQEEIDEMIYEAVDIEKAFVNETMPEPLLGMNAMLMHQYVEYIAHRLMSQFGYTTKFKDVKCPFAFMDKIALQQQVSFFDGRVSEYRTDETGTKIKKAFNSNADF